MAGGPYNWFDINLSNKLTIRGSGSYITAIDGTLVLNSEVTIIDLKFNSGSGTKVLIQVSQPGNLIID